MKVHLRTFGCRANHYDSEAARAMLVAAGHEMVEAADDADVAVFNSCAVTAAAEAELRKSIRAAARRNPRLRSVVTGCAAALDARRSARSIAPLPTVTDVIPGADLTNLGAALGIAAPAPVTAQQSTARAVLRIQDGCDEHCTFCVTTVARGANRSRLVEDLVSEARALAEWHSEIVITGIHIGTYGSDTGASLGALMQRLVRELPCVRFRLSSIEATELDETLIELIAGAPESLVPHVHAPLQSGSDRVLKRMGRHWYTSGSYARAIERVADRIHAAGGTSFGLGADVIAGFPGESDAEHGATLTLLRDLPFTYLHVFPFSRRPEAPAERLDGHLPSHVIAERAAELREVGAAATAAYERARDGGTADVVVVSGAEDEGRRQGLTEDYLTVAIADCALPRGARAKASLRLDGSRLVAMLEPCHPERA